MTGSRPCRRNPYGNACWLLAVAASSLALAFMGLGSGFARAASPGLTGAQLVVLDQHGTLLLSLSLADDPTWIIRWNHSVTGIVVSDYYEYTDGVMYLRASHTPSFDAGLGHVPGRGRVESDGAHGYWIRDLDEPVAGNAYRLRVGASRVDHRVVHAGATYSLSAVAAGLPVTIEVRP